MTLATIGALAFRVAGVVGAAALVTLLRRRASAAERHWVWMTAVGGALLLPIVSMTVPAWRVVPWPAVAGQLHATPEVRAFERTSREYLNPSPPTMRRVEGDRSSVPVEDRRLRMAASFGTLAIEVLWLAGMLLSVARLVRAHARARAVVRASSPWPSPPTWTTPIAVRRSDQSTVPFTYGIVEPVILFPAEASEWTVARLDATMRHELAHAARRDGVALLVAQIASAVYWWHPAIRWAARQAAAECERACDDVVLRHGARASDYGSHLLAQARHRSVWGTRPLATIMFGRSEGLAARITALLDPRTDHRPLGRSRKLATAATGVGLITAIAAATPYGEPSRGRTTAPMLLTAAQADGLPAELRAGSRHLADAVVADHALRAALPRTGQQAKAVRAEASPSVGPACIQADPRVARTMRDSTIAITGAGAMFYDDGSTRLIWTGVDCIAWIRFRDPVTVAPSGVDVVSYAGSQFAAHDESPAGRRDYVVADGGARSLSIDGRPVEVSPADRAWIADMVREYIRRTGMGASTRASAIVERGGVVALLDEVRQIAPAGVRVSYLRAGFAHVRDGDRPAFIHDGAILLDSASARGEFLLAVPASWRSEERTLAAIYGEAAVIEPDDIVEELLRVAAPPRPVPESLRRPIETLIGTLQSVDRRTALRAYYLDVRP